MAGLDLELQDPGAGSGSGSAEHDKSTAANVDVKMPHQDPVRKKPASTQQGELADRLLAHTVRRMPCSYLLFLDEDLSAP